MSSDSDPEKWEYFPHTKAKHDILASYLDGWYPILSSWNGRLLYLDGFAGRGRYENGADGSPLVALRQLIKHRSFPAMRHREFVFYFIEANSGNAASLQSEIDMFKQENKPWPDNIKTMVFNERFTDTAASIIGQLRQQKRTLAPTFAFVDPFGYSGLPIDVLTELLNYERTEIFVNFMVGPVHRFITRSGQEKAMQTLFGMDVDDILDGFTGDITRVEHLRSVYAQQLKTRAKFEYVQSFAMINNTGNIGYYLLHGTSHPKGVELMKNAMWKVDPGGGFTFSDRIDNENVLFVLEPDLRPLRHELLKHFAEKQAVPIDELEWHTVLNTPFKKAHLRKVLRPLETEGSISVQRPPGKKQFAPGVTITFS